MIAILSVLCLLPEAAQADTCGGSISPPVISVRTLVRPASHDFSRGIVEITSDQNLAVPYGLEDFKYATGATKVEPELESRWALQGQPLSGGGECWQLVKLQITLTVHTKVYVAKEVPRNSCLWNEIMRHEEKHVQTDRKLFPRLANAVRPKIVRKVSRSVRAKDRGEAEHVMRDLISKATGDAIAAFLAERNKRQLAIDTREEYTRANYICGDAEILAAFKRAGIR